MHKLIELPYDYKALEPYIDAQTMEIHHSKHHQGYVNKLNAALENYPDLQQKSLEELLTDLNSLPQTIREAVRNNGGGVINHNIFWETLAKGKELEGDIKEAIQSEFDGWDSFKEAFSLAASSHFGSGWVWLAVVDKQLNIVTTANQDCLLSAGQTPILALDVWEHAYYLKYQNRRPEYIEAFFHIINWEKVNELYKTAMKKK